jgi:DNA-binding protein HU-beta
MSTAYIRVFKAASQAALGNVEAASMEVERILSFEPGATVTLSTSSDRLAAAPAQVVISLKHLAAEVAEKHELSKRQAETMLADVVASIGKQLKKGSKIRIAGLGILQVRKRAACMGRNPQTGEAIKIKASK